MASRDPLPDPRTAFGARVRKRLAEEIVIWWTTVGADGTPQPNPVWFLWRDGRFLVFNRPDAHRLAHIAERPATALHFDGDGRGDDIVVFRGRARRVEGVPGPAADAEYVRKYGSRMPGVSGSVEQFGVAYPVAVEIEVAAVRGY